MSVEIDIDLNAKGAEGKIGAIAASLKGLEQVADDIDIDFDVDASDITGEIDDLSQALDNIDFDASKLDARLKEAAEEIDGAEISVTPDLSDAGSTHDGESSGNDPPDISSDDSRFERILKRDYGDFTHASNDFLGEVLQKPKAGKTGFIGPSSEDNPGYAIRRTAAFGSGDPDFTEGDLLQRIGTRSGFGLDPISMGNRRKASDLSEEAIRRGADGSHVPVERQDFAVLEDVLQDFRRYDFDVSEQLQARIDARDRAAAPIQTPFGDNGLNYEARMSELVDGDLADLMDNPNQGSGNFFGEGQSDFVKNMGASLAQAQYEAFEGVSDSRDFTSFNQAARQDSVLRQDISDNEIRRSSGFIDRDFASGIGTGKSPLEHIKDTNIAEKIDDVDGLKQALRGLGNTHTGVGRQIRRLAPSMSMVYNIVAASLPAMIALGTQLLGVAAAMGAVAVAGAGIIGLGLIGHGDSMAESFQQAKVEFRDLKEELYDEAQPLASQFAPIQGRIFDAIPDGLDPVFEEMEGLTGFEDTLFDLGSLGTDSLVRFFAIIDSKQGKISQLTERFAQLAATNALDFFEWLIDTASENQQLIVQLGGSLEDLLAVVYNLSMFIGRLVGSLEPFFEALRKLSNMLDNRLLVGMLTAITVAGMIAVAFAKVALAVWGLISAVMALHGWFVAISSGGAIAGMITSLQALGTWLTTITSQMTMAQIAARGLAAAIAATGVGALVVGGGIVAGQAAMSAMSGPPAAGGTSPGGAGGNTYNDNRNFTINAGDGTDYASQKSIEDTVRRVNSTDDAQELPPVGGNST